MKTVAFVGGGPTAIYTLDALVKAVRGPISITIFEEQALLGRGTPYRAGWNDPAMLANIASIELPPITKTLVTWLLEQPPDVLSQLGVNPQKIGDRTFYPRLVLGEYFHSQSTELIAKARVKGLTVEVRNRCRVIDVSVEGDRVTLNVRPSSGVPYRETFDYVVLATGHQWPASPEVKPGYFLSPWPASALSETPACEVGIRGTSLTAIDAMVAVAALHGRFTNHRDGTLEFVPAAGTEGFHITMMSRKGILSEADFFAPLPYQPLHFCTDEEVNKLIQTDASNILDRAFDLFKLEISFADPDYAMRIEMLDLSLEEFHDRYFADRLTNDPFEWAWNNLKEAQRNYEHKFVVRWRYAILRMHEVIERLVPYLEAKEYRRFTRYFKPVFVDDYATVPHKSIRRMLALHKAGKLDVVALGDDYTVDSNRPGGGAAVAFREHTREYPVFIEAMGQQALPAKEFPFPSLVREGIIRDVSTSRFELPRGIAIDNAFHPVSDDSASERIYCLSLPFILGRHPFHQGITSSHAMGQKVGAELAKAMAKLDQPPLLQTRA